MAIAAWCRPVSAANFDCAKATLRRDKLICADATLSKLDEELARVYRATTGRLSNEGRRILRDGQRSWVKYVRNACPIAQGTITDGYWEPANVCMREVYNWRIKVLSAQPQTIDSYTIVAVEEFHAKFSEALDEGGQLERAGISTSYFSYPQLDQVKGSVSRSWNELMARHGKKNREGYERVWKAFSWFKIRHASAHLIVVEFETGGYNPGAAHGWAGLKYSNFVVGREREVTAADLFDDSKDWKAFLARSCEELVAEESSPKKVRSFIYEEQNWELSSAGLTIHLGSIFGYASGPQKVTVSWSALNPS